jgi:ABC-type Na+ efflux pump permease subunit
MMATLVANLLFRVGFGGEVLIASATLFGAVALSMRHRRKQGWHWRGTGMHEVFWALGACLVIAFVMEAAQPGRSPFNPRFFPWFAAAGFILVFAVLNGLGVVSQSEKEFQQHCGPVPRARVSPPVRPRLRCWKRRVVNAYQIYFLLVWVVAVAFFWQFNAVSRHGSPIPTSTQMARLANHNSVVYVTLAQAHQIQWLSYSLTVGIPSLFVVGAFLHFVVGVRVFSRYGGTFGRRR